MVGLNHGFGDLSCGSGQTHGLTLVNLSRGSLFIFCFLFKKKKKKFFLFFIFLIKGRFVFLLVLQGVRDISPGPHTI
jgi:hypothetical protein